MSNTGPIPALRGYRLQFLYTLLRVLEGHDAETVHPEKLEDYSVSMGERVTEIVQVKNYGEPLSLSDLSPGKEKGFVRRSVDQLEEDSDVSLKLVVLGELGQELLGLKANKASKSIRRKLTEKHAFTASDADLFISKLEIIQVQAVEVRQQVENMIAESIAGADVVIATDMLLYWMYQLAERQESVSRADLVRKMESVGQFINERVGFLAEFGASILPLGNSGTSIGEKEKEEFQSGIAAKYNHIESGLDVDRPEKMAELDKAFAQDKVMIVHGASGQGKSTLAYRYAYERYPRGYAFEVSSAAGANRVLDIARAVNALARPFDSPFLLLIDVAPGTSHWVDLCRQLSETAHCQMLVTIREEDLSRAGGVGEYFTAVDVSLSFTKDEAAALYEGVKARTKIPHFLNFVDAWSQFGGEGPLLEFMFLLRQGERLRERLANQIARIEERVAVEGDDNELKLLRLVAVAGAYDCRLELQRLLEAVPSRNPQRTLRYFQDEYLLREVDGGRYLEALHPVRAKIMAELLCDSILAPAQKAFAFCQPLVVEADWGNYILQYGYHYGWDDAIMSSTLHLRPRRWRTCKEMHRALVWCGVNAYLTENEPQLNRLRQEFPMGTDFALMKLMAPNVDLSVVAKVWKPEKYARLEEILAGFTSIDSFYNFADEWQANCHYPKAIDYRLATEISGLGYILFWNSKQGIGNGFPDKLFEELRELSPEDSEREATADLLLGLQHDNAKAQEIAKILLPGFLREFQAYGKVPTIEDDGKEVKLYFFFDIKGEQEEFGEGLHGKTMRLLRLIRKALPFRELYSTQGYGHKFSVTPLRYDESVMNIKAENLPWPWLTDSKQIFFNLVKFEKRFSEWSDLLHHLLREQSSMVTSLRSISVGLRKKMKKGLLKDAFRLVPTFRPDTDFALPKTAVDSWGFHAELKEGKHDNPFHSIPLLQLLDPKLVDKIKVIKDFHQKLWWFFDRAYVSLTLKEVSVNWTEEIWEEKAEQLTKAGYSRNLLRMSKMNLVEAWQQFTDYKDALSVLAEQHLSETELTKFNDLSDFLAKLMFTWPYLIDYPVQKQVDLDRAAARRGAKIVEVFERKLNEQLAGFKSDGGCVDYEVYASESTSGDWYLLFYVNDINQKLQCWDKVHGLVKSSLGSAPFYEFKRIVLDEQVKHLWILPVYDDFLIRRQAFRLSLFDVLDRESEAVLSVNNVAKVAQETVSELSLDFAADSFPEFDQAERYNELFHGIHQTLEYLEQLSGLLGDEATNRLILEVEIKKTYLDIRDYHQEFLALHEPLMDHVKAAMKSPFHYLPAENFMENISNILLIFQRLEDLLEDLKEDGLKTGVLDELVEIRRSTTELMEGELEVYFGWLDLLIYTKLKHEN